MTVTNSANGLTASTNLHLDHVTYDFLVEFKYLSAQFGNEKFVVASADLLNYSVDSNDPIKITNFHFGQDMDQDGFSNLQELKSGTDPRTANDQPQPAVAQYLGATTITGNQIIELVFDRSMDPASLVISGNLATESNGGSWKRGTVDFDTLQFIPKTQWSNGSGRTLEVSANDSADLPMQPLSLSLTIDSIAPTVTQVNPSDGSVIRSDTPIVLLFSEAMSSNSTFSGSAIANSDGGVWTTSQIYTITPNPHWGYNATLDLSVNAFDIAGNNITANYSFNVAWVGTYLYGGNFMEPHEAEVIGNNIYVSGITGASLPPDGKTGTSDYFTMSIDLNGNMNWVRQGGAVGKLTYGYGIGVNKADETSYSTGFTQGNLAGNTLIGIQDLFVTAITPSGSRLWTTTIGNTNATSNVYNEGHGLAVDSGGNIIVAGKYNETLNGVYISKIHKISPSGGVLWTVSLGPTRTEIADVTSDSLNNIIVTGYTTANLQGNPSVTSNEYFIAKYNSSGTLLWVRQVGGGITNGTRVLVDSLDNILMSGWTTGPVSGQTQNGALDALLVKYDSAGTLLWTRQLGDSTSGSTYGYALSVDANDSPIISGYATGSLPGNTVSGTSDAFVAKYSSTGTRLWVRQIGVNNKLTRSHAVSVDQNNNVYLIGYTYGNLDGNTNSQILMFITKYTSAGVKQ